MQVGGEVVCRWEGGGVQVGGRWCACGRGVCVQVGGEVVCRQWCVVVSHAATGSGVLLSCLPRSPTTAIPHGSWLPPRWIPPAPLACTAKTWRTSGGSVMRQRRPMLHRSKSGGFLSLLLWRVVPSPHHAASPSLRLTPPTPQA